MKKIAGLIAVLILSVSTQAQYAGRYTDGKGYAVYFEQTKYGLTIRPVMWTATQVLKQTEKDKFVVVDRTSRGADFRRDDKGRVVGVAVRGMDGEGLQLQRSDAPLLPVEMLLSGHPREAAEGYVRGRDTAKALDVAEQVIKRLPTKTHDAIIFLNALAPHFLSNARFHSLLGYSLVQAGDRASALKSFRRAYELDSQNEETVSALARLNELPSAKHNGSGWTIPFSLASVFAAPTPAEIAAVEKDWSSRDLEPRGIKEESRSSVVIADHHFDVRIVSHLVLGKRHYGVILTPPNATGRRLPVIIEAKGVSPTYFPLDLANLSAPRMMDDISDEFIYVVPTYRGEVLNFNGATYTSEGDRTDALDGATDDTIALLNVALRTTPEIDPEHICAFGRSRGGTVAMLTGIRDRRIDCVVNWSGPTDWFYLMGTNGWTEEELWGEALRTRATSLQTGGQNVERFLKRAIDGEATLAQVRHRLIASSPLYFAARLPSSQHHYGEEDTSVPIRNGVELAKRLASAHSLKVIRATPSLRDLGSGYRAFFYPGQGHDTDRIMAPIYSREFIRRVLGR